MTNIWAQNGHQKYLLLKFMILPSENTKENKNWAFQSFFFKEKKGFFIARFHLVLMDKVVYWGPLHWVEQTAFQHHDCSSDKLGLRVTKTRVKKLGEAGYYCYTLTWVIITSYQGGKKTTWSLTSILLGHFHLLNVKKSWCMVKILGKWNFDLLSRKKTCFSVWWSRFSK